MQPTKISNQARITNVSFNSCAKFFRSIYISGEILYTSFAEIKLESVEAQSENIIAIAPTISLQKFSIPNGVITFNAQILLNHDSFPQDVVFIFKTRDHGNFAIKWENIDIEPQSQILNLFKTYLQTSGVKRMLDIGGRARSGRLRKDDFPALDVDVLDILPGDGVTIVCDAHRMSETLDAQVYDAVMSVSVFEHLVMPWKVAVEMNRIMKPGAIGLIITHQTVGMHDLPWDFFRFSDSGWKGIFNKHTGFEIIKTELSHPNYIIPFKWASRYIDAEKAAGFEFSAVLVRKIGGSSVDWPLGAMDVTSDSYPSGEEPKNSYVCI